MLARRGLLLSLFAPAIIRTPGLLMPIKPIVLSASYPILNHTELGKFNGMTYAFGKATLYLDGNKIGEINCSVPSA